MIVMAKNDVVGGVLAAMGASPAQAIEAIRLPVGHVTTVDEVSHAARALIAAWYQLTTNSPRATLAQSAST